MSFKAWAQTKIPVAHRVIKTVQETKTMRIRGELLPNGFRVGERVYWQHYYTNQPHQGTILATQPQYDWWQPAHHVWALWDQTNNRPPETGWMPVDQVHRV